MTPRAQRERRKPRAGTATAAFEESHATPARPLYVLRLYVSGVTLRSTRAVANVKAICEEHLAGRYDLEVIDVYQYPVLAAGDQIIAVPTLIKSLPGSLRRLLGDLSDREQVLMGLDLKPRVLREQPLP